MTDPTTIGPYRIVHQLGRGGMGVVYLAEEPDGREVAVKRLHPDADEKMFTRFLREAAVLADLDHPDIVRTLDHGIDDRGHPWIVMEYLDGFELELVMTDPTLDLQGRLSVIVRVADALHYIHERDLVHRDVKPSNIFITKDGGVRLLDFGVALIRDARLTRTGMLMGTPHYMAPEQLSSGTVDRRTDVFALGVVLYRLLSERFPWPGDVPAQVMFAIATRPPDAFDVVSSLGVSEKEAETLREIVSAALAAEPSQRFQTAFDLGAALEAFLQGETTLVDIDRTKTPPSVAPELVAARRVEWARARAVRLELEPTGRRPNSSVRNGPIEEDEDRDSSPMVWTVLVIGLAAALAVASWYAFVGAS